MRTIVLSALGAVCLLAAVPAAAQTGPTLDGEMLTGGANPPFFGVIELDCNDGGVSTARYEVSGAATGPLFPGTFTESGTFTIEDGQVTEFRAEFTILSGLTEISGAKHLSQSNSTFCNELEEGSLADAGIDIGTTYTATISSPLGVFSDTGTAETTVNLTLFEGGTGVGTVVELFDSDGIVLTAGHATGGGYLGDVAGGIVSFGFNVMSDGTSVRGQCRVTDHTTGDEVKCLNAKLLNRTATHATFSGEALVNGVKRTYVVDVDDLGEPGAGGDTFKITTDNGFAAAGVLSGGNVQIHD